MTSPAEESAVNERDIFLAAIQLTDPVERSAYVGKACAGNDSLKRHVQDMLDAHPDLGTFPESPAVDWEGAGPPLRAGRFQLGDELARGGMGIIYRARDDSLGRDVAVKVLHERYPVDSLVGQRFLDEARITAQLQHPAIPPVFEVGRLADDRPYLAMKLIKGRTLEELLHERSGPAADRGRFLSVFQQVCQAVGYAHSRRILHRDLKTANVMVGAFGEVQVMDWGLAKVLEPGGSAASAQATGTETIGGTVIQTSRERDSATLAGSMLGTPAFMSPEQAGGELDKLDERTDVFGLGAILCVILTGEPAYVGKSSEEVRLMAVRGTLADAHARLDQCGADAKLVELCRQCLAADRDSRPKDAAALAAALAGYVTGVEERARRAEVELAAAETRATEQRKRRRVQLALAATVLVVLGLVGFGLWWQKRVEATAAAERAARDSRVTAGVTEALREARERAEEAWNLAEFPDRMQHATDAAVAALRRGEGFASGGAPDEITRDLVSARREVDELWRHTRALVGWIRILRIADDRIKKKDWNGARAAVQEAIRLRPKNVVAHRKLAEILYASGKHAEALRTTVAAVREHPDLAEKPGCYVRYTAACYALRCADGRWGKAPPQAECPAYRKQALDFLTAELASFRKVAAKNPAWVHKDMQLWLTDKDLASVRDPPAVERLPPDERDAWNRLWTNVRALRDQTAPRSTQPR
jgi:tetratricopeptide (TPR) repeat protein